MEILRYLLTGGAAAGVFKLIDTFVTHFLSKKDVTRQALLALLHDRLYQACNYHITKGWCSIADKKNLEYMFEPYKKLGGNGTAEAMFKQCQALPIQKLEEKV